MIISSRFLPDYFEWLVTQTKLPLLISWNADNVTEQTISCLKNRSIPSEVLVGSDAKFVLITLRFMPAWFRDILFRIDSLRHAVPASMTKKTQGKGKRD